MPGPVLCENRSIHAIGERVMPPMSLQQQSFASVAQASRRGKLLFLVAFYTRGDLCNIIFHLSIGQDIGYKVLG